MNYEDQFHLLDRSNQFISPVSCVFSFDRIEQSKTPTTDTNFELCQVIKGIKHVKKGKKGEFRLLQENIQNLKQFQVSGTRLHSSVRYQEDHSGSLKLSLMEKMKNSKKISKKMTKNSHKKKNISQYLTSEDKSSYFTQQCENIAQNSLPTNDLKFRSKNMVFESNKIKGNIGHSSLVFSHQITEGAYYIEFKVLPFCPMPGESQYLYNPEIRIGVCGESHKLDTPLGFQKSIAFHLSKKLIITQGKIEQLNQMDPNIMGKDIKCGDIIGFLLDFSPPYKYPDSSQNWSNSSLSFYLNGQLLGKYSNVKQMFYYPAISIYNGASLEFHIRDQEMIYKPSQALAYEKIKQYINIYN